MKLRNRRRDLSLQRISIQSPETKLLMILAFSATLAVGRSLLDLCQASKIEFPKFVQQEVESQFGVGYAVTTADINRDGKIDIVAINPTQAVWFENPTWKKHLMIDGLTKRDNVCIAATDVDGDGRIDLALGAE